MLFHNKNEHFTIQTIDKDKQLLELKNFLSPSECKHLINISDKNFIRSPALTKSGYSSTRTSNTYHIPKSSDNIIINIEKRIAKFCNVNICQIEPLQVVRYKPGQKFDYHYDWFDPNNEIDKKELLKRWPTTIYNFCISK